MQNQFPQVSKAQWLAKVEKDLKGKSLESLDFEVAGKIFSPLHHQDDHEVLHPPLNRQRGWQIGVEIVEEDIVQANKLALKALGGGAEALWFTFKRPLSSEEKIQLLAGIYLDMIEFVIDDEGTKHGLSNVAQELAFAAEAPGRIPTFYPAPQQGYFESIAYYRAVRLCWANVAAAFGETTSCKLVAFLPPAKADDPNQNKISSPIAAMAAVCGGADTLYIAPSDPSDKGPFSARIARNIQHLLREESYMDRVADPAAGSYYIESLTDHFAQTIWAEFQSLTSQTKNQ